MTVRLAVYFFVDFCFVCLFYFTLYVLTMQETITKANVHSVGGTAKTCNYVLKWNESCGACVQSTNNGS